MKHPIPILFRTAWHFSRGRRLIFIWTILSFIISNAIILSEPALVGRMFNAIQEAPPSADLLQIVFSYLWVILLIPFAFWLFHGTARVLERKTAFYIHLNYKKELLMESFELPLSWHRDHHSGEVINKVNRASRALYDFAGSLFEPLAAMSKLLGAYVALFFISPRAGVIGFLVSVVAVTSVILYDRILMRQYDQIYLLENRVAAVLHDYLTNIVTVVAMRLKTVGVSEVTERIQDIFSVFRKNIVFNEVKWFSVSTIIALMIFAVLGSHVYFTLKAGHILLVGTLYSLYAYLDRISGAFYDFAWQYSRMVEQATSVRSAQTITSDFEAYVPPLDYPLPVGWKSIEVRNLYFTYLDQKKQRHHLDNLHLVLPSGAKIALVGSSGGGKSTTMALLRGIYHAPNVTTLADGVVLPHGLQHLYGATTLLPQDPEIFAQTLRYNITMGRSISPKLLQKTIEMSRLEPVLKRLKKGLSTNIAEKGVNLSGGEKQRLALARGLLAARSRPILLMDEPTSSVDAKNEGMIYEQIFEEYQEKTIVASIHRLHLLKMFDHIYLIDEGKIVEEGSLEQLIAQKKTFYGLWRAYFRTHKDEVGGKSIPAKE